MILMRKCSICGADLNMAGICETCPVKEVTYIAPNFTRGYITEPKYDQWKASTVNKYGKEAQQKIGRWRELTQNWTSEQHSEFFRKEIRKIGSSNKTAG
jgi:hypothetical protein